MTSIVFGSTDTSRLCVGYFADAIHNFYTPDELADVLHLVGFTNVRCRTSIWAGMVGFHAAQKATA
jgi:demethylmenaquinone methyltransferase/2-methoxy-6-polyprenyl-1,4-benzoquinol methylase